MKLKKIMNYRAEQKIKLTNKQKVKKLKKRNTIWHSRDTSHLTLLLI